MRHPAAYRLLTEGETAGATDILGLWAAQPQTVSEVSFPAPASLGDAGRLEDPLPSGPGGVDSVPPANAPVWLVHLPADPAEARRHLEAAAAALRVGEAGIQEALDRLAQFVAVQTQSAAFVLSAHLPEPEAEAAGLLNAICRGRSLESFEPSLSFGAPADNLYGRMRAAVQDLLTSWTHYAYTETQLGAVHLATTSIGWTGHMRTVWCQNIRPEEANLHRRSLDLAMASRDAWVQGLMLALTTSARLAALLHDPLLALPAVWRLITRILADRRQDTHARENDHA